MQSNNKKYFDTSHLKSGLKKRSLRGGAITVTQQGLEFIIQLVSTMVLARILVPGDYGIMAMVMAITGFVKIFGNLGLSAATIQRAEVNHAQVSTLFWINAGLGVLLTTLVAGFSPFIAWFYNTPELVGVTSVLSVKFLLMGFTIQHQALLNRQMRFLSLAVIKTVSALIAVAAAILIAVQGHGYWALVGHNITVSLCTLAGIWMVVWWIPGLPRRNAGVGSLVKFGSDIMGFNVIEYFSRNLDNILIGRYYGSGPLGFYSKAYKLMMMPIHNLRIPMNKVAMPALSRLQNEPENYRNYYMKYISILAFVSMPLVTFLFVCSDQVINIVLGSQWMEASELFKILALVALVQPVFSTYGVVLVSTGKSRRYLVLGVIGAIIICTSFIAGLPWGTKGVATGYAIGVYLKLFPFLYYSFRQTPVKVFDFLKAVYRPCLSSLVMGVSTFLLLQKLQQMNDITIVVICLVISFFVYLMFIVIFSNGTQDIREYCNYGKLILGKS